MGNPTKIVHKREKQKEILTNIYLTNIYLHLSFKLVIMKKLYTLLLVAFIGFVGKAQIVNIPDANFKAKLLQASPSIGIAKNALGQNIKIDTNNDSQIQISEALTVFTLGVSSSSIQNMTGIEAFSNLRNLSCNSNQLTSLNVTQNTALLSLQCYTNQLSSLDVSQNIALTSLQCYSNQLTSLNVTQNIALTSLECYTNQLTNLDVTQNTALTILNCYDNLLTSLNITQNTALTTLYCYNNQLTSLNVSQNTALTILYCDNNQLTSLNVSQNTALTSLRCSFNQLTSLDVTQNTALDGFSCEFNQLTSLDVTQNTALSSLNCSYNQITNLDVTQNPQLTYFRCSGNQLINLDVSQNPVLYALYCDDNIQLATLFIKNGRLQSWAALNFDYNSNLRYICADEGDLSIVQNKINQYGYTDTCHVNTYCSFTPNGTFYTIQGNSKFDSESNGCDSVDLNIPNLKIGITTGTNLGNIIANTTGNYFIPVATGNHTIAPILENPSYFNVLPVSSSISFPSSTSPYTQNFCVTPNGVKNDLEVTIIPIEVARPGFDAFYKIIYKNKGNQVANGSLSFNFNDAIMDLVSTTPIVNATGTNSLSWNFSNLNPFETREINLTFNINSPTEIPAVNGGNVLSYNTTIIGATDETTNDNTFTLNQTVVNSYDPNDKTCLEGNTITPSMVGEYLHYVIRFENTGTFAAQNVVIKDMIDTAKFDINTLFPQTSSHSFVTKISNTNKVEFIFENINLPFDDANNDGYVAFKIKTKPTLVVGNTFSNSANIYFDYNFPIVTNTATTIVTALGTQDFDFGSVYTLSPVPAKDFLTITAQQDVIMSSSSIYNTLGQLVQVNTNPNETIDVTGLQSGSYFIRITSDKGSATGKFIKE